MTQAEILDVLKENKGKWFTEREIRKMLKIKSAQDRPLKILSSWKLIEHDIVFDNHRKQGTSVYKYKPKVRA